MAAASLKVDEEISRAVLDLLAREPFFGHLLGGVTRVVGEDVTPTAAVGLRDGTISLIVNPTFFLKALKTRQERVAVLKHEVLHLALKHLFRWKPGTRDRRLLNIACDLVVNQFVGKPWKLPGDACTLDKFPGLPPDQTADWYYERLLQRRDEVDKAVGDRWHSDHGGWPENGEDPGAIAADVMTDRLLARTAERVGVKGWSLLPGPLRDLVAAALTRKQPEVDWRRALRLFTASSTRTRIVGTIRRQSRRYGTFPGIRVKRLQRIAVAVDTSGSISDDDLATFFAEIHGIWRQGAEVHVLECDAAVQRVYRYTGKLPASVGGRGGTAFDPVFQHLRQARQVVWDGCIYLTDGCAQAPTVSPPCRLLWIVTGEGSIDALRFGRIVRLKGMTKG